MSLHEVSKMAWYAPILHEQTLQIKEYRKLIGVTFLKCTRTNNAFKDMLNTTCRNHEHRTV